MVEADSFCEKGTHSHYKETCALFEGTKLAAPLKVCSWGESL